MIYLIGIGACCLAWFIAGYFIGYRTGIRRYINNLFDRMIASFREGQK
jgi:hypothetical protein